MSRNAKNGWRSELGVGCRYRGRIYDQSARRQVPILCVQRIDCGICTSQSEISQPIIFLLFGNLIIFYFASILLISCFLFCSFFCWCVTCLGNYCCTITAAAKFNLTCHWCFALSTNWQTHL